MAKPNSKELKRVKDLAERLLEINGIDHDEWLYEQYLKVQSENLDVIDKAMSFYLNHKKSEERKRSSSESWNRWSFTLRMDWIIMENVISLTPHAWRMHKR